MIKADIIPHRVIEVLTKTPPFNLISDDDRLGLIQSITISLKQKDEILFEVNQSHLDYFFLLERGAIKLTDAQHELVTMCDEGEILGVAAFLREGPYLLNAICDEECLIYKIPWNAFSPLLTKYSELAIYFASGFASGTLSRASYQKESIVDTKMMLSPKSGVITAFEDTSLLALSKLMKENRIGSIVIVNDQQYPIGMVTKSDIVFQIAESKDPRTTKALEFMARPVLVFKSPISYSEAILVIMSESIRHLVFTEDGTTNTKVTGVISEHDVLASTGENPIVIAKQIREAKTIEELKRIHQDFESYLKRYIAQDPPINFLMRASTQINDLMTTWIIRNHVEQLPSDIQSAIAGKWAWIAFGSQGRKEQILSSDQDNGIIYDDSIEEYKETLLAISEKINNDLDLLGFIFCPANVMAKNPFFTRSLSAWKNQIAQWIESPQEKSVMYLTIMMDYRVIFGQQELKANLDQFISAKWKNDIALMHLAQNALSNPPPLNFFRSFIVEKSGQHIDQFNIKKRALIPIIDIVRTLAIANDFHQEKATIARLRYLENIDRKHSELYQSLREAFLSLQKYRIEAGLRFHNSGEFINIDSLSKLERQNLKVIFKIIDDGLDIIRLKFLPNRGL